jgi:hypothetical protein
VKQEGRQSRRKEGGCSSSMHLLLISFQKTEYWYHSKLTQASELERGSNMAKVIYLFIYMLFSCEALKKLLMYEFQVRLKFGNLQPWYGKYFLFRPVS